MKTKTILLCTLAILTITGTTKAQNIPNYIPTNGLVGWWPFNGNANDESGNGNDGVVNGASMTSDRFENPDKSFNFDGIDDIINLPINSGQVANSTQFSIQFWIIPDSIVNTPQTVFANWHSTPNSPNGTPVSFYTGFYDNNSGYNIFTGYANSLGVGSDLNINYSNWNHIIITYDGSQSLAENRQKVYYNGYLQGNNFNCQFCSSNIPQITGSVYNHTTIGARYTGAQNNLIEKFKGKIDDIAIWNRALTQQEISALYTASSTNNATSNTTANVPSAISYQAVARDAQGMPLADANLQVQFTLITDSISGAAEYEETHTLSTNNLGLFTTAFGAGTPVSNTFGNINWSAGNKFLKVQIDTGNGWMDMGTQQLLSTPYSMHSATSGAIKNPGLPVFADNAAALAGGLVAGDMYRTASGDLKIVY
jgi:hypothetical protein